MRASHSIVAAVLISAFEPVTGLGAYAPLGLPLASPESGWPQFRGPRRDGICEEKGLSPFWPEGGPSVVWSVENLGTGFSSPIISRGRIYITGDVGDELHVFALDLSGKPVWQAKNGAAWKEEYPGARASVTYYGGHVYHRNAHGRVACFDAENGSEVWAVDIAGKFGGQNITWGLSECLLVDGDSVYVTAGGTGALLVALNRLTGETLWKSAPLADSEGEKAIEAPSYGSPILLKFAERTFVIGSSIRHLFCADAATGKLEWTKRMPTRYSVLAMTPLYFHANQIFMTAPHGNGGQAFHLNANDPGAPVSVHPVWTSKLDTCQGGVIEVKGTLYGSFYSDRKGWAAVSARTGEVLYTNTEFAKGAVLYADKRLYVLAEDGWMLLIEPTGTEFAVKGRFRLAEAARRDAWAHPVVYNGRLYLRYHDKLTCYDVRAK
jgi:outer membrane protein assembly factor BamB